jgi:hypothetical protein
LPEKSGNNKHKILKEGKDMRKNELYTDYHEFYEYFGNTEIERIRKQGEKTIRHDWIIFDTVEEAMDYFNNKCGEFVGYYA